MKYLLACLIIPSALMLFFVAFTLSALYIGVEKMLDRIGAKKFSD